MNIIEKIMNWFENNFGKNKSKAPTTYKYADKKPEYEFIDATVILHTYRTLNFQFRTDISDKGLISKVEKLIVMNYEMINDLNNTLDEASLSNTLKKFRLMATSTFVDSCNKYLGLSNDYQQEQKEAFLSTLINWETSLIRMKEVMDRRNNIDFEVEIETAAINF